MKNAADNRLSHPPGIFGTSFIFNPLNSTIMSNSEVKSNAAQQTTKEILENWLGHRRLTRRVIAAFPEKDFTEFSIGGMRPFAKMVSELLGIAGPGMKEIVSGKTATFDEKQYENKSREEILRHWDQATAEIESCWEQLDEEAFNRHVVLFGQYEGTVLSTIHYFIDNEIHHRAQGYVYLRALGIEPPAFYDRS